MGTTTGIHTHMEAAGQSGRQRTTMTIMHTTRPMPMLTAPTIGTATTDMPTPTAMTTRTQLATDTMTTRRAPTPI